MKKTLTLLASLALCVTVGGVYAAWNYAEEGVKTSYATATVGITGIESKTEKGVISVVGTNVALMVDDVSTDTKTHTTVLTCDTSGYFTVTFTVSNVAPKEVRDNGMDLQWYIGLAQTNNVAVENVSSVTYNEIPIYDEIVKTPVKIAKGDLTNNGDGTFTYTISMEQIKERIILNEIVLETSSAHDAYSETINDYIIHVHVGEYVATP